MLTVRLRSVRAIGNYEAHLLPVSKFPMPENEFLALDSWIRQVCAAASAQWSLFSEVFMQLEQLSGSTSRQTFSDHARAWLPQTGLGVWVDRDPPRKWTEEETANIIPGDKLRPIMFQVFRVSTSQAIRLEARSTMLRFGSVLEILTRKEDYTQTSSPIFKHGIVDRSFTCFPYYVGLMEAKTISNATPEQLDRWFDGISVYIRASFEDKGILIASALPISQIFQKLGGLRMEDGWQFSA